MLVSVSNPYSVRNRALHTSSRGPFSQQNIGNLAFKACCIDKVCGTLTQLPVWLISSSSKLKANAVLRLKYQGTIILSSSL